MLDWLANQRHDPLLAQILQALRQVGTPCYLVGGAVRDWLLDLQPEASTVPLTAQTASPAHTCDLDFTVPAGGLRIARTVADELGAAFYPLDAERDVGRIVFGSHPGQTPRLVDIAAFQAPTLVDDLAGRDFRINAMAVDITRRPFSLIDPHGGQSDLQARVLRAVSDHAMLDDPVRTLRAVRFRAQLGFNIEAHTRHLVREAASQLTQVSAERVRDEFAKMLSLPGGADSVRQMDRLNLLPGVVPELASLKRMELPLFDGRRGDAFAHSLDTTAALEWMLPLDGTPPHSALPFPERMADYMAAETAGKYSYRLLLTVAALLHEIDRPAAVIPGPQREIPPHPPASGDANASQGAANATLAAGVMRRLRFPNQAVQRVRTIIRYHQRPHDLAQQGTASRREIHRYYHEVGDTGVDVAILSLARYRATADSNDEDERWSALLKTATLLLDAFFNQHQTLVSPTLLLTGNDLVRELGLAPGPRVGQLLAALGEAQAVGEITDRQQALQWVRNQISDHGH